MCREFRVNERLCGVTSSVDGWLLKEEMNHKRRERDRKEHWPDLWEQVGGCEAPRGQCGGMCQAGRRGEASAGTQQPQDASL